MTLSLRNIDGELKKFPSNPTPENAERLVRLIIRHAAPVELGGNGTGDVSRLLAFIRTLPRPLSTNMRRIVRDETPIRFGRAYAGFDMKYKKLPRPDQVKEWSPLS